MRVAVGDEVEEKRMGWPLGDGLVRQERNMRGSGGRHDARVSMDVLKSMGCKPRGTIVVIASRNVKGKLFRLSGILF